MIESCRYMEMICPPFPAYISSGFTVFDPGDLHGDRIFPAYVIMFIVEGTVFFKEGEEEHELKKGEWFIQSPGIRHFGYKASSQRASYYWIHFMPVGHASIIEQNTASRDYASMDIIDAGEGIRIPKFKFLLPMRHSYPIDKWLLLLEEMKSSDPSYNQSIFTKLIGYMCKWCDDEYGSSSDILAEKVAEYIKSNYFDNLTIKKISAHFHFTPDHITRCFRKRFGITPGIYLSNIKLDHARSLLINTNKSVQSIAAEIGYGELAVFSRGFRKAYGASPSLYRKRIWGR